VTLTYEAPAATGQRPHDEQRVLERISELKRTGAEERSLRQRIQAIMDGGARGIAAVMAWDQGRQAQSIDEVAKAYGVDLAAVNMMASGVERLGQRVGDIPYLRAAEAYQRDLREQFAHRRAIVADWDEYQQLELLFPQIGRWLPGYTQFLWTICQGYYSYAAEQIPYPYVHLRDSFDVYMGHGLEPDDALVVRRVPLRVLQAQYPEATLRSRYPDFSWRSATSRLERAATMRSLGNGASPPGPSRWEGEHSGIEVCEYMDAHATSLMVPDLGMAFSTIENPVYPEPPFVAARRYSFNLNVSAYHHVIGLNAMMARLNILGLVATEDGVFAPTNIIGELESGEYLHGRGEVNLFSQGSKVERGMSDQPQTLWAMTDRIEKQLRIGASYDLSSDGISPNSYATQAGIQELQSGVERNVAEYQKIIRRATERLDTRRLMWAERVWPKRRTKLYFFSTKEQTTYTPAKHIKGDYRTRRRHAVGGLWGSTNNVVQALQLLQTGVLDIETIQDAVPGIGDGEQILQRNRAREAEKALMARLASTPPGQPLAVDDASAVLVAIMADPDRQDEILTEKFTPPPPEEAPPEMAPPMGMEGGMPGETPPGIMEMLAQMEGNRTQTTMSRIMSNNTADAGVQLVGRT
jgi:hypothetical protein